ncbi:DnaJ domain-containing protein [Apiosordaria backusii]|uniref:DnaJ domain-containing protein n=1 Tax=Apiosordaria backusii TaxID=314023 RepID=A0AA40BLG5_9PEZI|nr:DnaJ domain-containing protein [Apiosordaria backusii]
MIPEPLNYYRLLGAWPSDDDATLRKAFRKRALLKHPDKHGNSAAAKEDFQKIQNAYDVLANPTARAEYHIKVMRRIMNLRNLESQCRSRCHHAATYDMRFRRELFGISFQNVHRLRHIVMHYGSLLNVSVERYQEIYNTTVAELAEAQRELAERAMAARRLEGHIRNKMRELEHYRREIEVLQSEYIPA